MHIFVYEHLDGRDCLVKDRRFFFEQEVMPRNYPLDIVYVDEDNLVICDALRRNACVYEELPSDHMNRYGERLKNRVDPHIKWVFACPVRVHKQAERPAAILCCFGRTDYFRSKGEIEQFEMVLHLLSEVVAQLLRFQRYLRVIEGISPFRQFEDTPPIADLWI